MAGKNTVVETPSEAPSKAPSEDATSVAAKAVPTAIVLPVIFGGSALSNGVPVLILPEGAPGPVPKTSDRALPASYNKSYPPTGSDGKPNPLRPNGEDWYFRGTFEINGARSDVYTTHNAPNVSVCNSLVEAVLGDKIKRASKNEAREMIKGEATRTLDTLVANFRKARPDLEDLDTQAILRMILGG